MPIKKEEFSEVKNLIANGKTESTLNYLLKKSPKTIIEADVILLSNQYQKVTDEFLKGLITKDSRDVTVNNINNAILGLENKLFKNPKNPKRTPQISKFWIFISLGGIISLIMVLITKSSFDTSDIFDARDGKGYKTMIINDLEWFSKNIDVNVNNASWCYANTCNNSRKYGRLYNFDGAIYACNGLGRGWRLPTKEDLVSLKAYIDSHHDSLDFDSFLGGEMGADGTFMYLKENGILWSSTLSKDKYVWAMYLHGDSKLVEIIDHGEKTYGYSCRCVRGIKK